MRYLKIFLFVLALSFALAPEMKLRRVQEDIYMVRGMDALPSLENRGFMSNAFAVLTSEGWVVIDALSTPELSKEFVDNLMKVKKAPIRYALITHYHPDHWYGVKTYKELGAKVIAHKNLLEFYNSGEARMALEGSKQRFGELFKSVELSPPDVVVEDRMLLKLGGKSFEITALPPAHTNSDLLIYMPDAKVLFTGDLVLNNRIPFMGDRNASSKGLLLVLQRIKSMDVKVLLGGHNEPMDMSAVDFTIGYTSFLRDNIKKLKEEGKSIDQIREALKNNPYSKYVMYEVFHSSNVFKLDSELDVEE
ncbi:MAG: MBL fold metallo-hydrolase [Aquificaceae bacterium]|nr:MBL fold metallo-hydrolase [Aquificaceae bacterium]MDW8434271.1 MBL fold metallo-hydrolase [Aquificaceae bacterium]